MDLDRRRRCGFPEVVFAEGKTVAAMEKIFDALLRHGDEVLATRISPQQATELAPRFPAGRYNAVRRTFRISPDARSAEPAGRVAIARPARATCRGGPRNGVVDRGRGRDDPGRGRGRAAPFDGNLRCWRRPTPLWLSPAWKGAAERCRRLVAVP